MSNRLYPSRSKLFAHVTSGKRESLFPAMAIIFCTCIIKDKKIVYINARHMMGFNMHTISRGHAKSMHNTLDVSRKIVDTHFSFALVG